MAIWWKLKREAKRLGKQVNNLGGRVGAHLRRTKYDKIERQSAHETAGSQPLGPDIAIILIYQPDGLLASTFWQLEQLNLRGVTPFLVSNHTIKDEDRDKLIPLCHLILERPNLGFDFGGYRDGILTVIDRGLTPERLFILNDSVWFPLNSNCTLIEDARAATADLFGIFYKTRDRDAGDPQLQSYFYRFNATMLRDPRFERYWRSMPLYNDKEQLNRECSVKLAGIFQAMGYHIDTLVHPQNVIAAADRLSDVEFNDVAQFYASTSLRGQSIFSPLTEINTDDPEWSKAREHATHDCRLRYYFTDSHPMILMRELQAPFLKKSTEYQYHRQRAALVEQGWHMQFDPIVAQEVATWNACNPASQPESPDFPAL